MGDIQMKSAYELAMERLEKAQGPTKRLTDAQRERIAEIDRKCDAKVAEQKMGYEPRIAQAQSFDERNALQDELAAKIRDQENEREKEKNAVWSEAG